MKGNVTLLHMFMLYSYSPNTHVVHAINMLSSIYLNLFPYL